MATVVWSGSGYPITSLASVDAEDVLTVTWNTLVSSDSRGRSGATSAYGNTPIQDDTLTLSHTLYFTAVDGDYSFVEVQSGDGVIAAVTTDRILKSQVCL